MLIETKTSPPPTHPSQCHLQMYRDDCTAFRVIQQTDYRPSIKQIKGHEAHSRVDLDKNPTYFSHIKTAHHSRNSAHTLFHVSAE